jgi:hypothetical protein
MPFYKGKYIQEGITGFAFSDFEGWDFSRNYFGK